MPHHLVHQSTFRCRRFDEIFSEKSEGSSKVLRADGRLVNMSGVFCTNNAQAPSLFSNVTLTSRRTKLIFVRLLVSVTLEKREGACALFVQKTPEIRRNQNKLLLPKIVDVAEKHNSSN